MARIVALLNGGTDKPVKRDGMLEYYSAQSGVSELGSTPAERQFTAEVVILFAVNAVQLSSGLSPVEAGAIRTSDNEDGLTITLPSRPEKPLPSHVAGLPVIYSIAQPPKSAPEVV
jgi:hypothetical protein